jgi:hypothetical protein
MALDLFSKSRAKATGMIPAEARILFSIVQKQAEKQDFRKVRIHAPETKC